MDDVFEIELQDEEILEEKTSQLPVNFLSLGEIEFDDVKVYIRQDVYAALEKYALADVEHERGTILIGESCEANGKLNVVITNYIEAKYCDATASTLTFTHETWNYVFQEQAEKYPDKKIVGWQHTHPSYGIFLSNYDLFIHENFFNLPFQIAYVIDPVQKLRGFFQWKNNKIEKLKGFYIYEEIGKTIELKPPKADAAKTNPEQADSRSSKTGRLLPLFLAVICLVATAVLGIQVHKTKMEQAALAQTVTQQRIYIMQLEAAAADQADIEALQTTISEQQAHLDEQQSLIDWLMTKLGLSKTEDADAGNEDSDFISYEVKSGDTLYSICRTHHLDYSKIDVIVEKNNISDKGKIYVGQTLLLPKNEE